MQQDDNEEEVKPGGKACELKTLMQVYRLHKYLSARICEYVFIIRKSYHLVKNDIIGKLFGKKNPFAEIENMLASEKQVKFNTTGSSLEEKNEFNSSPKMNRQATDAFFDKK